MFIPTSSQYMTSAWWVAKGQFILRFFFASNYISWAKWAYYLPSCRQRVESWPLSCNPSFRPASITLWLSANDARPKATFVEWGGGVKLENLWNKKSPNQLWGGGGAKRRQFRWRKHWTLRRFIEFIFSDLRWSWNYVSIFSRKCRVSWLGGTLLWIIILHMIALFAEVNCWLCFSLSRSLPRHMFWARSHPMQKVHHFVTILYHILSILSIMHHIGFVFF